MARKRVKIKRTRFQKNIFLALVAICTLLGIIIIGRMFNFFTSLYQPMSKSEQSFKVELWDGQSNINLVVKSDTISVLSFNPLRGEILIINFPDEVYLDLPFGFGYYLVGSIYDLGQAEKPPMGARLLKESISGVMGIPIDGFLAIKGGDIDKLIVNLRHNPLTAISQFNKIETDLAPIEYIKLMLTLRSVRSDKVKLVDLAQSPITSSLLLPDGSRNLKVDSIKLDRFTGQYLSDDSLRNEALSVGIFNGTNHPALAQKVSRMITNIGGRVVFTKNTQTKFAQSYVLGVSSYTKNRLEKILISACPKKSLIGRPKCDINDPEVASARAQIVIILGEDYYQRAHLR